MSIFQTWKPGPVGPLRAIPRVRTTKHCNKKLASNIFSEKFLKCRKPRLLLNVKLKVSENSVILVNEKVKLCTVYSVESNLVRSRFVHPLGVAIRALGRASRGVGG